MKTLTFSEIGIFLQNVLYAFDEYLVMSFTLMITSVVVMLVRRLFYWG
jgi:hypothetical protein